MITKHDLWEQLNVHAQSLIDTQAFKSQKTPLLQASACHITLDYSHQCMTHDTLNLLNQLAQASHLKEKISALMRGDKINLSERRPALHTALRASSDDSIWVNDVDIMHDVVTARSQMQYISGLIRDKKWQGFTGKPITHIINIGIGGSDLGPRFCLKAFADLISQDLHFGFISDVDPTSFNQAVKNLPKETTLFIIASKSFTTQETTHNAHKALAWLGNKNYLTTNCIAVTANIAKAHEFGIKTVLPIWDWVGGRYSLCSAINLITAIAIGYDAFDELLSGARAMDQHFHNTDFASNLPVLLALIGIWNNNFLHRHNLLILTYAQQLEYWVAYVQQLDMESNGKCMDNQGNRVPYATGPVVWGGLGNQAQHSYYQLLCQGTHQMAADFITLDEHSDELINEMCSSKIAVLTTGVNNPNNPNGDIHGNLFLNHLQLTDASPFTIGALVALYEHKVFVQSVIWDINPFDQPGIDSAKRFKTLSTGALV